MFDTFSMYMMFRNTTFYDYDVHTILDFSAAYPCCVGCRMFLYYAAVWYRHDAFRHGIIPACARQNSCINNVK